MYKEKLRLEPFQIVALEKLSQVIGERFTGSEITNFLHKSGYSEYFHDGSTKWRYVFGVLQELHSSADGPFHIVKLIQHLCNPQEYIGNLEEFETVLNKVNEIVRFYGLKVTEDGKVRVTGEKATSLSKNSIEKQVFQSRLFHAEIKKHGEELFIEKRYFHAVFECCKAFDKNVREKSGFNKYGSDLMSSALSMRGTLKLNKQISETDRNEQEGIMHLCMGVMRAVRNPNSHEPALEWPINMEDALDILSLLNFLYRKIDNATYFSTD